MDSSQKNNYFRASDLFVLPSHTENFGMSIAEALSFGLPVLTTLNTPWEAIHGRAGWCVDLKQEYINQSLSDFFSSPSEVLKKMSAVGPRFVRKFEANDVARQFLSGLFEER